MYTSLGLADSADVSALQHASYFLTTMKLKEIHRTSTFAWSPTTSLPLLATGTVAGALDESFSNESQLEIWAPDFLEIGRAHV